MLCRKLASVSHLGSPPGGRVEERREKGRGIEAKNSTLISVFAVGVTSIFTRPLSSVLRVGLSNKMKVTLLVITSD